MMNNILLNEQTSTISVSPASSQHYRADMNINNVVIILINFLFTKLWCNFFRNFGSSILSSFVIDWLFEYFDMSVTDESFVDETRVWRTKL